MVDVCNEVLAELVATDPSHIYWQIGKDNKMRRSLTRHLKELKDRMALPPTDQDHVPAVAATLVCRKMMEVADAITKKYGHYGRFTSEVADELHSKQDPRLVGHP